MTQRLLIATLVVTALAAAVPAYAQLTPPRTRPERPTRGLFGGGAARGNTSQQLILNVSFGGGYDDDLLAGAAGSGLPSTVAPRSGQFGTGTLNLNYAINREHVNGSLSAGSSARYYSGLSDPLVVAYNAGGQVSMSMGSRTTLSMSFQAGVQPYVLTILYGDQFNADTPSDVPADIGASTYARMYESLASGIQFGQKVTQRLTLNAGYTYYATNNSSSADTGRYGGQGGSAGFSFSLAKGLSLRLNYGLQNSAGPADGSQTRYRGRTIDGGVDFNRALSLTRRSTLSFSTGLVGLSDQTSNVRYYFTGQATVSHEIGRSWTWSIGYNRSASFYQPFGQPLLSDSFSGGFGGLISRRLQFTSNVAAVKGVVGIAAGAPGYVAANAAVGLRLGITREIGLGVNYGFYHYIFEEGASLPLGVTQKMDRQSVTVSLDVWAPLLTRARRTNAAR